MKRKKINVYEMFACVCVCIYISSDRVMSAATKKKYVVNEALQRYQLPDEKNYVVKVKIIID